MIMQHSPQCQHARHDLETARVAFVSVCDSFDSARVASASAHKVYETARKAYETAIDACVTALKSSPALHGEA